MSENHRQLETMITGYTCQEGVDVNRAIDLNNEGTMLIDADDFTDAAFAFKSSSMILSAVISSRLPSPAVEISNKDKIVDTVASILPRAPVGTQEPQWSTNADEIQQGGDANCEQNHLNQSMVLDQLGDVGENDGNQSSIPSRPPTMSNAAAASIRSAARTRNSSSCFLASPTTTAVYSITQETTPARIQAAGDDTKNKNNNFHAIGRPLWIRKAIEGTRTRSSQYLTNLSATVIYNLALTFHLRASYCGGRGKATNKKKEMIQSALELYGMSRRLLLSCPMSSVVQSSPVFLVVQHNMIQIYQNNLRNTDQHAVIVKKLFDELIKVLRMMKTLNVIGEHSYEKVYVQLLAVPKTNDLHFATVA
jgi:hypothetical protein